MAMPLESAVRPDAAPRCRHPRRSVYRKRIGKPLAAAASGISPAAAFTHGGTPRHRHGMDVA